MGQKEIEITLACGYDDQSLEKAVRRQVRLKHFTYRIIRKSLDSRRKDRIRWQLRLRLDSPELRESLPEEQTAPEPPRVNSRRRVVVAGSGPTGIFAALYLQSAGLQVILLERGREVRERERDIRRLETAGEFTPDSNYSFGEGGAGTFSDGKLTSRSKHIKREKLYVLQEFVRHGAPEEILYLTHPHIGSDNLIRIAESMRRTFQEAGGEIRFSTTLSDLVRKENRITAAVTDGKEISADYFLLATGHSSFDTYRMLMDRGISFRPKNFALGFRMEHPQELINRIQWGVSSLPGVKAAEYRLTSGRAELPVYTFCMCPGGKVVPAAPYADLNIVNGMSLYKRDGKFANAALVAGITPKLIREEGPAPAECLDWLEALERRFYREAGGYRAPAMTIGDFLAGKQKEPLGPASYEPGLIPADLTRLLPPPVVCALQAGLEDLTRRLDGFGKGQLMGLESKTSSPVQVFRDRESGLVEGTENLFLCGEASGYTGGIISSAADGIRSADALLRSLV